MIIIAPLEVIETPRLAFIHSATPSPKLSVSVDSTDYILSPSLSTVSLVGGEDSFSEESLSSSKYK